MQGILYLDKAPKLADEIPTATAKTKAKIKHINIRGSEKERRKKFFGPFFIKKNKVINRKIEDSMTDNRMIGEVASQINGL